MNDPKKTFQKRNTLRLVRYDYTQPGAYFITIVTHQRIPYFGKMENNQMLITEIGKIVQAEWFKTAVLRPTIELFDDEFILMPNHLHGIIRVAGNLTDEKNVELFGKPNKNSIPTIIAAFKSVVARTIKKIPEYCMAEIWQRNYYEHIIRNEQDLTEKRDYIRKNPQNWSKDEENI